MGVFFLLLFVLLFLFLLNDLEISNCPSGQGLHGLQTRLLVAVQRVDMNWPVGQAVHGRHARSVVAVQGTS